MIRLTWLLVMFVLVISSPAYAKDKDSSVEEAIEDMVSEDDHPGKGKGRPDNPGEHGRDNAAEKQSRGQGKGSKSEDSWEDKLRDEIEDDDKGKGGKKNKGKNN